MDDTKRLVDLMLACETAIEALRIADREFSKIDETTDTHLSPYFKSELHESIEAAITKADSARRAFKAVDGKRGAP